MPCGRLFWISATVAFTPSEMSSVLDSAWRTMPRPMPVLPSERKEVWPVSGPSVTVATSRTWVSPPMTIASNSSGVVTSAVVRTIRS